MHNSASEAVTLEPTVWQATKELGSAIVRSVSFKRRRPKPNDAATLAAEDRAAAAERAAAEAKQAAEQAQQKEKAAIDRAKQAERTLTAEQAAAAAEKAASAKMAELERQKSLPGLPPRASDVRAAVGNLGAAIGRSARRRSSVRFADGGKVVGHKPSPKQPVGLVGVVRRATTGAVSEPGYLSVTDGGGDSSEPALPPRASAVARAVGSLGDTERIEPGMPPRASAVARAVGALDRTASGEPDDNDEAALPGPPPRASLVARAMTRLVSRRSSGVPPLPPRASDVKAAVGGSRREKRQLRRIGGGNAARSPKGPTPAESEPDVPPPPSASDIAAAVRDL